MKASHSAASAGEASIGIRRKWKLAAAIALLLVIAGLLGSWLMGGLLCARSRAEATPPSDLSVEAVSFPSQSGATLRGWLVRGRSDMGTIVLMHAVRGSRMDMVGRARFLAKAGYSILLFDFQAHGESDGQHITFGHLERLDALAAVAFVRTEFPNRPVGVIGFSLGGAAATLATPLLPVDALVLEAVYPTLDEAIANRLRLRLGSAGELLTPLLTWQMPLRLGFHARELSPIERIRSLSTPKLLIVGGKDQHTTIAESRRLFAAAAEPKRLWEIPGAAHEDYHHYATAEYERRILGFLAESLGPRDPLPK